MPISQTNIRAVLESSSSVVWLFLLTITQTGLDPLRVVNNNEAVVSRGYSFAPFPFTVVLPPDDSEALPKVTLSLVNVDASIIEYIRSQLTPPAITIELVTSAYPDTVEVALDFLKLTTVTYDAITIQGSLDVDNFLAQRFPAEAYLPPQFPGLFR
ncbi:protein of unknown function [Variovorax sp. HW608]|uniref:DUF1833 family protein n=1 Tax=Variovorax sp. HW608 TaxID=1034889 RepID=UPI00081FC69D|nr:DUF1833 family protein [Variovorax sp. HW608]SCK48975.1 protein of unknown function [Variovorax sp. HW608]